MATRARKSAAERIRAMVRELNSMTAGELEDAVLELASLGDALRRAVTTSNAIWERSKVQVMGQADTDTALDEFVEAVKVAIARVPASGWFGDNKVFINRVWKAANRDPIMNMRYDKFKTKLLGANQKRLLDLSRADMVSAMDSADVRESETTTGTATFHFIRIG